MESAPSEVVQPAPSEVMQDFEEGHSELDELSEEGGPSEGVMKLSEQEQEVVLEEEQLD